MAERAPVNGDREALGVALEAAGNFTGWKAGFKYLVLYLALITPKAFGYTVEDEAIYAFLERWIGFTNLDYPLAVFVTHVNNITFERAATEGAAAFLVGMAASTIGRKIRT